jgi:hypothetical protein
LKRGSFFNTQNRIIIFQLNCPPEKTQDSVSNSRCASRMEGRSAFKGTPQMDFLQSHQELLFQMKNKPIRMIKMPLPLRRYPIP